MGIEPFDREKAEKRYWAVTVIRAFGILQILGVTALSYFYLRPVLQVTLEQAFRMSHDNTVLLASVLALAMGVFTGIVTSAMIYAVATFFDDVHAIKNYMRDMHVTGQYYDD